MDAEITPITVNHEGADIQAIPFDQYQAALKGATAPIEGIVGPDGTFKDESHLELFDEGDRPTLSLFKNLKEFGHSYMELRRKVGANTITVPEPGATPEAWDSVYSKLGAITTSSDITFGLPDGYPEGLVPEEATEQFKGWAAEARLRPEQATAIWSKWVDAQKEASDALQAQYAASQEESRRALIKEFGGTAEEITARAKLGVQQISAALGDPELANQLMDDPLIGDNPLAIKFFAKLHALASERGMIKGDVGGTFNQRREAQDKLNDMLNNPHSQYYAGLHHSDKQGPAFKAANAEFQRLNKIAYTEE